MNGVYINGEWREGNQVLEVINPATEALLAHVSVGDAAAVTLAVDAASAAFADWSKSTGRDRGALLRKIAEGVDAQREQLMHLQSSNNGKPLFEAGIDVDDVIATFEYYAAVAEGMDAGQDRPVELPSSDFSARLRREPCGVVGASFQAVVTIGKFHGTISPTTPQGSRRRRALKSSPGSATGRSCAASMSSQMPA